MSWICDYCSTANDDRDTECFVCGRERSKKSILEAKRAAQEERTKRVNEMIYKSTTIVGRVMCFSSITLFSVIAIILLCLKIQNSSLGDLIHSGIAIADNIGDNFKLLFSVNVVSVATQLFHSGVVNTGKCIIEICLYSANTLQSHGECLIFELFTCRNIKYEAFSQKFIILIDAFIEAIKLWWTVISILVVNSGEIIGLIAHNVGEIFKKAKELFCNLENK